MALTNGSMVRDSWADFFSDDEYRRQLTADLSNHKHDYYFGSYSNFYIHEEMLKDDVRTKAY